MPCSKLAAMEKRCEFCMESKAVVFCKSDAAHLCLTCDAKVHSANALSHRHPRTLVCESCRNQPAFVRCFDHRIFMCQSCDITHHLSSDHHKKIFTCFVGCPSAKDLAHLWGLDLVVEDSDASVLESGGRSSSGGKKEEKDEKQEKSSSYLILQQILDLKRLQLSESIDDSSCLARVKERACGSPFRNDDTWKDPRMLESCDEREREEGCLPSSPFSHMENFTSNGNPINGDSFWHLRSPLHNNEIWLQNMQDLGVCDEVQCFEDVNIPEVDLTFQSFEELFGNEEETSNGDQHPPFDKIEQSVGFSSDKAHYKEKKSSRYEKQGQYMSPRTKSDFKKRGRNQSLKGEGFEGDCGSVNGSF